MRLQGKVALVTGGTSGIGAETVRRLVDEGASVIFTGRNATAGAEMAAATGADFQAHRVEDADSWPALVDGIVDRYGRLDIAFANAGIEGGDTNIEAIDIAAWRSVVDVNLTGAMLTAQNAIRAMKRNPDGPSGSIVLNSSMNGILALGGNVGYSTTKGALRLLAKSIAMHCANSGYGIRCNTIHPGVVETPMITAAIAGAPEPAAARRQLEGLSPMRRMATMAEIASLVVFLGSDEAAFVTGAEYVMDGGATAGMNGV